MDETLGSTVVLVLLFGPIAVLWWYKKMRTPIGQAAGQDVWSETSWTIVEQTQNRFVCSDSSRRVPDNLGIQFISENLPSSTAPFHEVSGTSFPSRRRSYLRVDLGFRPSCSFQIFERAALAKQPFFSLVAVGAMWFPRWADCFLSGDPRLDSRFELYAEDSAQAKSLVATLTASLLAAPPFGLLEIAGSELRVYVSTIAAGLPRDSGAGVAAHVDTLRDLLVDVASTVKNA